MNKLKLLPIIALFVIIISLNVRADISNGLLTHLPFDASGATGSLADTSGAGYSAGVSSTKPTWVAGKSSSHALKFTGENNPLTLASEIPIKNIPALSVAMWVKFDTLSSSDEHIVSNYLNSANFTIGIVRNKGNIKCNVRTTYNVNAQATFTNDTANWHHIACVYDGSKVTVYIDGIAGNSVALTGNTSNAFKNLTIGGSGAYSIDDLRIYNRGLSSGDVSELVTPPVTTPPVVIPPVVTPPATTPPVVATPISTVGTVGVGNSITHKVAMIDFTWQFNCGGRACKYGQFVNGDYWVVPIDDQGNNTGTVTITNISPVSTTDVSGKTVSHGAEVNPIVDGFQGLMPMYPDLYRASRNIMLQLPYTANPGDSIFKSYVITAVGPTLTVPYHLGGGGGTKPKCRPPGCVGSNDVLTILPAIPPNNGATVFRPPFSGTWKPLFTTDKVRFERLASIPAVSATFKGGFQANADRAVYMQLPAMYELLSAGDTYRDIVPLYAMEGYARDQATAFDGSVHLTLGSETNTQKAPIVYALMQKGIDKYAMFRAGIGFGSGAGQRLGKKGPIAYFAALYDDTSILNQVRAIATDPKYRGFFQEDTQVKRNKFGVPIWGDFAPESYYWSEYMSEWRGFNGYVGGAVGGRGDPYGYIDGGSGKSTKSYQGVTSGPFAIFTFNQLLMPWYRYANGYDALIEYIDRMRGRNTLGNVGGWYGKSDLCAGVDTRELPTCDPFNESTCKYYKKTWGPDPVNPGQCLLHSANPATTLNGRWTNLHGANSDPTEGFGNAVTNSLWNSLRDCLDPAHSTYGTGLCTSMGAEGPDGNPALNPPVTTPFSNYFNLTVERIGNGGGYVLGKYSPLNCGILCTISFFVAGAPKLIAVPDAGSVFSGWSGTGRCRGSLTECYPSLYNDITVKANFTRVGAAVSSPTIDSRPISFIESTKAWGNASVTSIGGGFINSRGFQFGTTTAYGRATVENGSFNIGNFGAPIRDLVCNTTYNARPYVINAGGIAYGSNVVFTTASCDGKNPGTTTVPPVTTTPITDNDKDGVVESIDFCPGTPAGMKEFVNTRGCIKPKFSTFDIKPDDTNLDLSSISFLELGKTNVGKIKWIPAVQLTRSDARLDVDTNLTFSTKKITLNSANLPELNKPAQITLYGITETRPKILKDGLECTTCVINSFVNGILVFTVTGFSTYEVKEGTAPVVIVVTTTSETVPVTSAPAPVYSGGDGSYTSPTNASVSTQNTQTTASTVPQVNFNFTRNLTLGSKGVDVKALQVILNSLQFKISAVGAGSPGLESDYFGPATKNSLGRYQLSKKIFPALGYFGLRTRAVINKETSPTQTSAPSASTTTSVTTSLIKKPILKFGDSGADVKALRTKLRNLGYSSAYGTAGVPTSASVETTFFGTETLTQVKKFQCDKLSICSGSPTTNGYGTVGPKTMASLEL